MEQTGFCFAKSCLCILIRMELIIRIVEMTRLKVSVYLSRVNTGMTEQHLYRKQVSPILYQVRCETVPQRMHGEILLNTNETGCNLEITPDTFARQPLTAEIQKQSISPLILASQQRAALGQI